MESVVVLDKSEDYRDSINILNFFTYYHSQDSIASNSGLAKSRCGTLLCHELPLLSPYLLISTILRWPNNITFILDTRFQLKICYFSGIQSQMAVRGSPPFWFHSITSGNSGELRRWNIVSGMYTRVSSLEHHPAPTRPRGHRDIG